MKKLISSIIALALLLSNSAYAGTVTFGYGKTFDWSSTYWSTLTNVQDTNITTPTASDGWKKLAFVAATTSKAWTDMDGWTESNGGNGDSSISSNTLVQDGGSGAATTGSQVYDLDWANGGTGDATFRMASMVKFAAFSTNTNTNVISGSSVRHYDGARAHIQYVRSDGTNLDIYSHSDATNSVKVDTSVALDTTRYHVMGFYCNNANDADVMVMDGVEIATGLENFSSTATPGRVDVITFRLSGDVNNIGATYAWTHYFNTIAPFATADGVMESSPTASQYDAGVGNRWSQIDWTAVTANSTALTVEYRVAGSAAALAAASYATATSGAALASKDRFIQIKITMADASSGQYTPVLKDMTLTNETPAAASGGFRAIGGVRKIR